MLWISQASKGYLGNAHRTALSSTNRSPMVCLWPRSTSDWRCKHWSAREAFNASKLPDSSPSASSSATMSFNKSKRTLLFPAALASAGRLPSVSPMMAIPRLWKVRIVTSCDVSFYWPRAPGPTVILRAWGRRNTSQPGTCRRRSGRRRGRRKRA